MASMLSRGAILAECLVKNSTPKVRINQFKRRKIKKLIRLFMQMQILNGNLSKGRVIKEKVGCHVSYTNIPYY